MTQIYLILALSFFLALIFTWSKRFHGFSIDEQPIIGLTATFASILFALLLSFTVANFYDDYQRLRGSISKEALELEAIYEMLQDVPDGQPVIQKLRSYLQSVVDVEWPLSQQGKPSPQTDRAHLEFKKALITYIRSHPGDPLNNQLGAYVGVDDNRHVRLEALQNNNFMITIVVIAGMLTLVAFWFLNTSNIAIQIIVDFGVITIIALSLYLLWNLSQPLRSSELGIHIAGLRNLYQRVHVR